MQLDKIHRWRTALFCVLGFSGLAMSQNQSEDPRAVYWFFSLNDASEIQFHGSALTGDLTAGQFVQTLPSDSAGTLHLMVEYSTGSFLDTPDPEPAAAASSAIAGEAAVASAAATPAENAKTRTVELMRIWALDDDFNDIANWTFRSVQLSGHSDGDTYIVRVNYQSVELDEAGE